MSREINRRLANRGNRISASPVDNQVNLPVIFSLQYIQSGKFCFSLLEHKQKGDFADALYRRKDFTWHDLRQNDHRKLGVEQLPVEMMKERMPAFHTEDVEKYDVIRFSHNNGRIVGFRKNHVFYILWIDCGFKLYPH